MRVPFDEAPIMGLCIIGGCLRSRDGELDWQNGRRLGRITHRVRVIPVGRGQKKA